MPYSQMLTACLLTFNIILPVMVVATINNMFLAIILTFISTVAYQARGAHFVHRARWSVHDITQTLVA
jgi:hypothetical protein